MAIVNLTPPVVSGVHRRGEVLQATDGTWTSDDPLSFQRQWYRCDVDGLNCTQINAATSRNYLLTASDIGTRLKFGITPSEAPIPTGDLYDSFSDFEPPWADMLNLQRFQNTNWTPLGYSGTAWGDGSGIFEISTVEGPGFRWYQGTSVPRASGAGVQTASHFKNGSFGEYYLTMKLMFPSANNPDFPNYGDWNAIWEFVDGSHTVRNQFGIDDVTAGAPKLYIRTYGGVGYPGNENNKKALAPVTLTLDVWHDIRWDLNLSKNSDGFARFWYDGTQILDHSGATLSSDYNSKIWSQFGWYGGSSSARNEVQIADLRVG